MDTIIVVVVALALIIMSTLVFTVSAFQSAHDLTDAWQSMETTSISIKDTEISIAAADAYTGGLINVSVWNEGKTNLYDYSKWDGIIQHQSGLTSYLAYADNPPPGSGEWAIEGIFIAEGESELFDPGILNPGEMMIVAINPNVGTIGIGDTVRIIISTPNGVTSQCFVTRE